MATPQELREKLIGAWTLISCRIDPPANSSTPPIYPMGQDATGIILYTPDGYMSAQLMASGRSKFKADYMMGGMQEELAEAAKGYIAYSGGFSIELVKGEGAIDGKVKLCHHMPVALFPNWEGDTQERIWSIEDVILTLKPEEPVLFHGVYVMPFMQWRKMEPNMSSQ